VKGSDGSIWAFGDASTIEQPRALQRADELFEQADTNKVRRTSLTNCAGTWGHAPANSNGLAVGPQMCVSVSKSVLAR
jgi:hypothetical protein